MPLPAVYDVIFALLIIIPLGLVFFSSAFLYNKLCEKELLSLEEGKTLKPIEKFWNYLVILGFGLTTACLFYYLITNDSFDFTLIALVPSLFVAYCIFHGFSYGLSIIFSFALVFAIVFIPRFILRKSDNRPLEIMSLLIFSILGSYCSPLYALIYVTAVYFILTFGYELPNYISKKHKGKPIFTFRIPLIAMGTGVLAVMLFI